MQLVSIALGFLIGFCLGLLGGGGSILTVPVFVYVLGYGAKESIAMSLTVVGATSLVGAVAHWRHGDVKIRVALVFGVVAMFGAYFGTRLAARFTGAQQLAIFGGIMIVAAGVLLRKRGMEVEHRRTSDANASSMWSTAFTAAQGFVVGSLTGLVGIGGGFLIVPALVWSGLAMREAVATSLVAIAMNCAVGFYGYVGQVEIAWMPMALVTVGTIPGIATGAHVMQFVSPDTLRRAFAMFLVVLAVYMLYHNLPTALEVAGRQ